MCNNFIRVVSKGNLTIMAWELMNEIRCPYDHSGNTMQGLYKTATLKKIIFN